MASLTDAGTSDRMMNNEPGCIRKEAAVYMMYYPGISEEGLRKAMTVTTEA